MGTGPPGPGVLHTSGKAEVTPLLSLVTTAILLTPTLTGIAPPRARFQSTALGPSGVNRTPAKPGSVNPSLDGKPAWVPATGFGDVGSLPAWGACLAVRAFQCRYAPARRICVRTGGW